MRKAQICNNFLILVVTEMTAEHFKRQPHKMVKHTQTIRRLSIFDHSVGLALKELTI